MLKFINETNEALQRNLKDWHVGGPKKEGWTRTGPEIEQNFESRIINLELTRLGVDHIFAKNKDEVMKWHVDYLNNVRPPTLYEKEYLAPRFDAKGCMERAFTFRQILHDMQQYGYDDRWPVWVADVSEMKMGFRWFRFDGCHRAVCAHHIGMKEIPTIIFKLEVTPKT